MFEILDGLSRDLDKAITYKHLLIIGGIILSWRLIERFFKGVATTISPFFAHLLSALVIVGVILITSLQQ